MIQELIGIALHLRHLLLVIWRIKAPSKHSSWWRRFLSSSSEDVLKTPSRRLDQDQYVHLSLISSEDVFNTSSTRLGQHQYICFGYTSSRRLQDVFQTSCQDVFKTFSRRLQEVLQNRLQNIFKTSSRRFEDVFKTYHQVKLFLLTRHLQRNMPR